jgi:hypothetical protein
MKSYGAFLFELEDTGCRGRCGMNSQRFNAGANQLWPLRALFAKAHDQQVMLRWQV